jgi:hypothetical protein
MADPNQDKNTLNVDPITVVVVIVAILLIPLLLAGFISQ